MADIAAPKQQIAPPMAKFHLSLALIGVVLVIAVFVLSALRH